MSGEHLYKKLPVFDEKKLDQILREAPKHKVKHGCIKQMEQEGK